MEKAYEPSHEPQVPVDLKSSSSASPVHTTPPKRRKALWRRTRRVLLVCALLIALLALTGFLYQTIASALDASSYPASGKLIDVGGYRLHLYCTGTVRPGSPAAVKQVFTEKV